MIRRRPRSTVVPYRTLVRTVSVTGPDGSGALQGLPPGDCVVEAWHGLYGTLTQNITIVAAETAELSFEFNADMSAAHVPLGDPIDPMHPESHRTVDHQ